MLIQDSVDCVNNQNVIDLSTTRFEDKVITTNSLLCYIKTVVDFN